MRNVNGQNGMASTRKLVHALVSSLPVLESCINQVDGLLVVADGHNDQILNISLSKLNVLPDL